MNCKPLDVTARNGDRALLTLDVASVRSSADERLPLVGPALWRR